jgi:hypothetical protein
MVLAELLDRGDLAVQPWFKRLMVWQLGIHYPFQVPLQLYSRRGSVKEGTLFW